MTTSPHPMSPDDVAPVRRSWARARGVLLIGCYAVLSLWAAVMSGVGPVVALVADLPDPSLRFTAVAAGGFKVLTLGPAVAVLISRGRSVLAVRALLAGQVVWFVTDVLAPQEDEGAVELLVRFVVSTAIWVGPWLLLSTHRRRLWSDPMTVRKPLAVLAVAAAVPLAIWARTNATLGTSGTLPGGGTYAELRYDVTGLPLALLVGLALASLCADRWWRAVLAGVCLTGGVLALVSPRAYGSPGPAGAGLLGVAVVLWSVGRHVHGGTGSTTRSGRTAAGSR